MTKNSDDSGKIVQKLKDYWLARSSRQRMIMLAAFAATFLMVAGFAWLAGRPTMVLLYGGLDAAEAGAVITEIDRRKIPYEVRGESIWVPASKRDHLRLELAGQGLPQSGTAGYELLDGLSGFGMTSQMFDAAYWRAKEGELARTILASGNIKAARVHLAVPTGRGYRRDNIGTASVTITTKGHELSREQAQALRFLVASGVAGMDPDLVTVIDSQRGIINTDSQSTPDRQQQMKRDVERILTAHVGAGNAIVELNIDIETRSEQLSERRFDPAERALISQEVEESSDQSTDSQAGAVTAASNLPDGQGDNAGQSASSHETTRQRSNFEVSETRRDIIANPGDIRRLSVAVLVNGVEGKDADGKPTITPRDDAELATLRELVASAVGFDEARGVQLTVKSLPFSALGESGTLATRPSLFERLAINDIIRLILIGLFAIAVALVILRPILAGREGRQRTESDSDPATPELAAMPAASPPQLAAPVAATETEPDTESNYTVTPPEAQKDTKLPEDPVKRLRHLMHERHEESIRVLSHWIGDNEKEAGT